MKEGLLMHTVIGPNDYEFAHSWGRDRASASERPLPELRRVRTRGGRPLPERRGLGRRP